MLADAEKYASVDQEQKEFIDLKNQAERLCSEAEKELALFETTLSDEKKQKVSLLIDKVKSLINEDDQPTLMKTVDELKLEMKDIIDVPDVTDFIKNNPTNSNSTEGLNDL